jgi:hypothetical protein
MLPALEQRGMQQVMSSNSCRTWHELRTSRHGSGGRIHAFVVEFQESITPPGWGDSSRNLGNKYTIHWRHPLHRGTVGGTRIVVNSMRTNTYIATHKVELVVWFMHFIMCRPAQRFVAMVTFQSGFPFEDVVPRARWLEGDVGFVVKSPLSTTLIVPRRNAVWWLTDHDEYLL